jgi:hypothetical protein
VLKCLHSSILCILRQLACKLTALACYINHVSLQSQRVASKLTVHYTPEGPEGAAKAQWNSSTVSSVSRCCALRGGVEAMAADALAQVCVCTIMLIFKVYVLPVCTWSVTVLHICRPDVQYAQLSCCCV